MERKVYSSSAAPGYPTPSSSSTDKSQHLDINPDTVDRSHVPEPRSERSPLQQTTHYDFDALNIKKETSDILPPTPARTSPLDWSAGPTSASLSSSQELYYDSNSQFTAWAPFFQSYPTTSSWQQPTPISSSAGPLFHEFIFDGKAHFARAEPFLEVFEESKASHNEYYQPGPESHSPSDMPQAIHWATEEDDAVAGRRQHQVDEDENDPYDLSDEDYATEEYEDDNGAWQEQLQENHLRNNDLGVVVAGQARQETHNLAVRSITSFIDRSNMLATYTPSPQSSPLNDSMTARLFCHFIHVTGPTMSMFERHPANPSLIFQGQPVSKSQQHIWTCKSQFAGYQKGFC
jgi:hypothetical protein